MWRPRWLSPLQDIKAGFSRFQRITFVRLWRIKSRLDTIVFTRKILLRWWFRNIFVLIGVFELMLWQVVLKDFLGQHFGPVHGYLPRIVMHIILRGGLFYLDTVVLIMNSNVWIRMTILVKSRSSVVLFVWNQVAIWFDKQRTSCFHMHGTLAKGQCDTSENTYYHQTCSFIFLHPCSHKFSYILATLIY